MSAASAGDRASASEPGAGWGPGAQPPSNEGVTAAIPADDWVAIAALVHRYADAVVHRDPDRWASCWAADATWDLGRGRLVEGREAILELWTSAMAGMEAVVQMAHNGDVEPGADADHATGRWYIDERFRRVGGSNETLLAHYDDAYVRTGDGWRFSRRFLQPHYLGPPDLSAQFLNTADGLTALKTADGRAARGG